MRPWNGSWAILLATGLGLMAAGCGGKSHDPVDVDEAPTAASGPEAAAPEAAAGGTEVATAEPAAPTTKRAAEDSAPAPAGGAASAPSTPAKAEDPSATNELLQISLVLASTPAPKPASPAPAAAGDSAGSTSAAAAMAAAYSNPQPGSSGASGSSGATDSTATAGTANGADSQVGIYTGESGAAGSGGGTGSGPGADQPGNFANPLNGVTSFLNAVKAKNIDGLAEAVALHAPSDALVPANQKLFRSILDTSISDEELADLAADLDGFQIINIIPSTSTGSMGVLVGKFVQSQTGVPGMGTRITRTITMRREQAGWKVQDMGPARSSIIGTQSNRGRRR
jgi:hypothetical protein